MPQRSTRRLVWGCVLLSATLLSAACSSQQISDGQRLGAVAAAQRVTLGAGLQLTDDDLDCVVADLGPIQAQELIDQADQPSERLMVALVDGVVDCVGTERLGTAALAAQAPDASEDSIRCAAAALDAELFKGLVLDRFVPQPPAGTELDLDVGVALATCLTPEELLEVSN